MDVEQGGSLEVVPIVIRRETIDLSRHAQKEKALPGQSDDRVQLTPRGRIEAASSGPKEGGFALGPEDSFLPSPKDRTTHNTILRGLGNFVPPA